MATLRDAQIEADTWLTTNETAIATVQATNKRGGSNYWQGLKSHTAAIAYTSAQSTTLSKRIADRLDSKPSDASRAVDKTWREMFPTLDVTPLPCVVEIETYQNATGFGYVIHMEITYEGVLYRRSKNYAGNETIRTQDWYNVDAGILE